MLESTATKGNHVIHRKSLLTYLIIAFSGAWVLFVLPLAIGEPGTTTRLAATQIAWAAAMWAPGVAAVIAQRFVDHEPISKLGLARLGPARIYLIAWLFPPLLTIAAGLLTYLFGAARLDLQFTALTQAMNQNPELKLSPGVLVFLQAVSGLTIGPIFNTLFALGEEVGWRAYLLPKLMPLGRLRAVLLTGLIWGVWHWPAILQGHNYPDHPYLGMLMMIGFTTLFGAFLSWLYLRTRSPWAPALGHASVNAFAGLPLLFFEKVDMIVGGTLTSLIGWIPMIALLAWLALRGGFNDDPAAAPEETA